jgi:hypothetical protein
MERVWTLVAGELNGLSLRVICFPVHFQVDDDEPEYWTRM